MARAPMRKPMAKKTVAKKPVAKKPTVKPVVRKSSSDDAKDIARAKTAVNKKRAAGASNAVRVANAQKYGVKQRMQKKEGLGTSLSRSGNIVGYGINYSKFKQLDNLAGDTVGEGDRTSAYWKKSSIDYLTKEALKMGVAKNKQSAKIAAQYIVKSLAQEQANINSESSRMSKKKSGK